MIAEPRQDGAHPSGSEFVLLAEVGNLVGHSCFGCSTGGPLSETERGCLIGVDQLLFHLIAGAKVKLLRRLIVFVDDSAISSGELNRPANDGAEHSLEIKSGADCLADFS